MKQPPKAYLQSNTDGKYYYYSGLLAITYYVVESGAPHCHTVDGIMHDTCNSHQETPYAVNGFDPVRNLQCLLVLMVA